MTIAIVSGANRGIGLAVVEQLASHGAVAYLGTRSIDRGHEAAAPLLARDLDVRPVQLDVTDAASIEAAVDRIRHEVGGLDVVVNNAAIHYDSWQRADTADLAVVREALETNLLGAWQLVESALPLLRASTHPRIVNVSSGGGALDAMSGSTPAYSISKLALNGLTMMLAGTLRRDGILVNAVCPGWVATDMGGSGGRPVDDGAAGVVWAATLPDDGPTGGFFRDRQPIDW